jgi:hypothetical protein
LPLIPTPRTELVIVYTSVIGVFFISNGVLVPNNEFIFDEKAPSLKYQDTRQLKTIKVILRNVNIQWLIWTPNKPNNKPPKGGWNVIYLENTVFNYLYNTAFDLPTFPDDVFTMCHYDHQLSRLLCHSLRGYYVTGRE